MSNRDTDVVSVICLEIAQRVGADRYDLYFSSVTFTVMADAVKLNGPNRFYCDWLRSSFGPQIEQACNAALKREVRLEYRVEPRNDAKSPSLEPTTSMPAGVPDVAPAEQSAQPNVKNRFQRR